MLAGSTAPLVLRRRVLGRLSLLSSRHPDAKEIILELVTADEACTQIENIELNCLPSPLDGHRRPQEESKTLPEDLKSSLLGLSGEPLAVNSLYSSQLYGLGDEIRSLLSVMVKGLLSQEGEGLESKLATLLHLGAVAAAERDTTLAKNIAEVLLRLASELREAQAIGQAVETLVRAAASFEEEAVWAEWLEKQFLELASRVEVGHLSRILLYHIQELKKVTRLELGIFRRAEAVASAATSRL
jgi:hypothetical protein